MAKLTIRYFVIQINQNKTERYYWQADKFLRDAGWKSIRLSPNKSEAMTQAEAMNAKVDEWRLGIITQPVSNVPDSVDALIADYKNSRHFKKLAAKTQHDYTKYLDMISEWAGDVAAKLIDKLMVQNLYEVMRKKKPRKAAYLIQVLRLLFSHAERINMISPGTNPGTKPKLEYTATKGVVWSAENVLTYVSHADEMGFFSVGTAVMLNEWLGQRRNDLTRLTMSAYRNGCLYIRQNKTAAEVILPIDIVPELKTRIEEQIKINKSHKLPGTSLIQKQDGRPYTSDGFMSAFERIREKAGKQDPTITGLLFKDLRHTAVTRLAEAGAEIPMIAAVTGHSFKSCQSIVDRYNIRTERMAKEAFQRRISSEAGQLNSAAIPLQNN